MLLGTQRFAPLFITQFLGAFNDNLYKNSLIILITFQATQWSQLAPEVLVNLAAGVFILPFFLFSATAGQLADKYDKALIARATKILEVLLMLLIAGGFWATNLTLLMTALFLMGLQSTLFGPVKYAILPQHLAPKELIQGNAWVEAGTFSAILLGTLSGGLLAGTANPALWIASAGLVVALIGLASSWYIPTAPAPEPELKLNLNPFTQSWRNLSLARQTPLVFFSIIGISWFWLYGALLLTQLPNFTKNTLGGAESLVTCVLLVFTLGIGLGSMLCARLADKKTALWLVPWGAVGLTLFGLDVFFALPANFAGTTAYSLSYLLSHGAIWRVLADLFLLGISGGLFIVPLYALMQTHSQAKQRARIIATNNLLNSLFMVFGALMAAILLLLGLSVTALFAVTALLNALVTGYIFYRQPEFLLSLKQRLAFLQSKP